MPILSRDGVVAGVRHTLRRVATVLCFAVLAASCASQAPVKIPPPRIATAPSTAPAAADDADKAGENVAVKPADVVTLQPPPRTNVPLSRQDWSGRFPSDDAVTVAVESMPLRDFIQYSFGELLKVSYVIADGTKGLDAPITLNVQKPVSSRALYKLVTELLATSGVGVEFRDGIFYLYPASADGKGNVPIGFGRRPQDVPDVAGRVMQVIPLRYGVNLSIERTVRELVDVQIQPDPQQSALFVTGERPQILRVLDVVNLLDQPANRARQVALVTLTYIGSRELTDQLVTLLENEGIPTGVGRADGKNVALVPLEQLGAVAVFTSGSDLLERVQYWIRQIDRPSQGPEERYFIYHPRNARATDLGESLAPLIGVQVPQQGNLARDTRSALGGGEAVGTTAGMAGGASGSRASAASAGRGQAGAVGTGGIDSQNVARRDRSPTLNAQAPISVRGEGLTLSVDPRSNTLIFYTTGLRYQALLPMVRRLDVPPKQVLLEATIAEVTLSGEFAYGVEFAFRDGKWSGGTQGNLGLPDGGLSLNWIGNVTDSVRAKLSATDSRVNILSNPTLVVRDGVEASILVGNDVPTVGATASDPIESDRVITTVLYRRTGLNLAIRPTINAQGLVVMEISQSISNTVEGGSDVQGAPLFFERAVSTEVVARSGQSILLAGLISESKNDTSSKVPGIGDVPGLGWLFKSENKTREKTELVVLITPRVIENPDEWSDIRSGLEDALENLELPPRAVAPTPPAASAPGTAPATPAVPSVGAPASDATPWRPGVVAVPPPPAG
jgi:general secretion pathway protein D